jgi:hypothetical protein
MPDTALKTALNLAAGIGGFCPSAEPAIDQLAKLAAENIALRKACQRARIDLQAMVPIIESAMPCPASGLRQTMALLDRALAS